MNHSWLNKLQIRWKVGWKTISWIALAICIGAGAWRYGRQAFELLQNEHLLKAALEQIGWLGPIVLIAFNTLQIIVAPIPGYVIQAAAGFLYGPLWGGIWATCGMLCGAMLAMWLARLFGRPLVVRLFGSAKLDQWNATAHSDHPLLWVFLLLSPIGDIPYFLAGLAQVGYGRIAVIALLVRAPTVFVSAAIGAGIMMLSRWHILLMLGLLGILFLVFLCFQHHLFDWINRNLHRFASSGSAKNNAHTIPTEQMTHRTLP